MHQREPGELTPDRSIGALAFVCVAVAALMGIGYYWGHSGNAAMKTEITVLKVRLKHRGVEVENLLSDIPPLVYKKTCTEAPVTLASFRKATGSDSYHPMGVTRAECLALLEPAGWWCSVDSCQSTRGECERGDNTCRPQKIAACTTAMSKLSGEDVLWCQRSLSECAKMRKTVARLSADYEPPSECVGRERH